jgi:hypothetical protein
MPESPPPDRQASSGAPPEVVPDTTIESAVDQMSQAAADLGRDVGAEPAVPPPSAESAEAPRAGIRSAAELDEQLAQTQELLDIARQQVGAAGEAPPLPPAGDSTAPVANPPAADRRDAGSPPPEPPPATISDDEVRELVSAELEARNVAISIKPPAIIRLVSMAVTILEAADRPFARLSDSVRLLIGWCAIATLAIALTTIFLSYL